MTESETESDTDPEPGPSKVARAKIGVGDFLSFRVLVPLIIFIVPRKTVVKPSADVDDSETESDTDPEGELNRARVSHCRNSLHIISLK